jgi:hypothetical protein
MSAAGVKRALVTDVALYLSLFPLTLCEGGIINSRRNGVNWRYWIGVTTCYRAASVAAVSPVDTCGCCV